MKTLKSIVLTLLLFILSFVLTSFNNETIAVSTDRYLAEVQLGGDTIGIQINTNVEIVGKYEIVVNKEKIKPWENSDIQEGDYIYSVNNVIIKENKDLNEVLRNYNKEIITITLIRKNEMINTDIRVVKNSNNIKYGE